MSDEDSTNKEGNIETLEIPNVDICIDTLCEDISNMLNQPSDTDTRSFSAHSTVESTSELNSSELNSSFLSISSTASLVNYHILDWRGEHGPGTVSHYYDTQMSR